MKKAKELLSQKSEIDEKNNSDTLKNQLNKKMDGIKATDVQKLKDEGKLNYTEKKQKQKIGHLLQTKNWKKKNEV